MIKLTLGQILKQGFLQSFRAKPVLALYLCNLLVSLIPSIAVVAGLSNGGRNPQILQLLNSDPINTFVDLGINTEFISSQGPTILLILLALFVQRFVYDLLAGGIISSWDHRYSFWQACKRWCLSNIVISLFVIILSFISMIIAGTLIGTASLVVGSVVGVVLLISISNVGEFARARAVATDRRNPISLFFGALWFCISRPITWLTCILGLLIIPLTQFPQTLALSSGTTLLLGIILQQLILLIASWSKILRLSWGYHYQAQRLNIPNKASPQASPAVTQI
jgi:hypothetical protein